MASFVMKFLLISICVTVITCCAPGWKKTSSLSGWCFLFSHNQVTWAEAEEICRSFEGYLAEPINKPIDDYLISETLKTGRKYWLGLSDLEQEGTFLWTTSQTGITSYNNWIPGDPNNANSGEDCVLNNWTHKGKWADGDCEWKEYYICQTEDIDGGLVG
ncbi:perlucin-like [Mytilus edulis]|uniref:perlucin-like n=1 Tax=Mytilus edulis TaxID=6550 RepID=UPI0039EE9185